MLVRDSSTGKFSFLPSSPSTRVSTCTTGRGTGRRPFALDDDDDETNEIGSYSDNFSRTGSSSSAASFATTSSRGYRTGGPKESRLKRVAFLSKTKDTDNLFSIKVENLPSSGKGFTYDVKFLCS
jgi:hypothetical protein